MDVFCHVCNIETLAGTVPFCSETTHSAEGTKHFALNRKDFAADYFRGQWTGLPIQTISQSCTYTNIELTELSQQ